MKNEVFWESFAVTFDLLIKSFNRDTVEGGQIEIENDGLSANAGNGFVGED